MSYKKIICLSFLFSLTSLNFSCDMILPGACELQWHGSPGYAEYNLAGQTGTFLVTYDYEFITCLNDVIKEDCLNVQNVESPENTAVGIWEPFHTIGQSCQDLNWTDCATSQCTTLP